MSLLFKWLVAVAGVGVRRHGEQVQV